MNNDDKDKNLEEFEEEPLTEEELESIEEIPEEIEYLQPDEYNEETPKNSNEDKYHNSKYYKDRQEELDQKVSNAKKNANETVKSDGTNTVSKNKLDRLKDRTNLLNAQRESFGNKVNGMTSKAHEIAHPIETLKKDVKEKGQEALKSAGNKVKEETKKGTAKVIKFIISKIPIWVWLALGGAFLLFLLIILFSFVLDDDSSNIGYLYDENCELFSLKYTSLSKDEFVNPAREYIISRGANAGAFLDNLDLVYTLSVKNNVNPELVIARAYNEGFSPGDSKYNYWGLGCTNTGGYDACMSFSSFEEGLQYFIDYVSQFDSVTSLMAKYTYIGKYWYNPGGSGLGGCYYFPYIRQYMSEERAKEVEKICEDVPSKYCSKDDTTNCVLTNEEDQKAKARGSAQGMVNTRQAMFGLSPDDCRLYSASCTLYKTNDTEWANEILGDTELTMAEAGSGVAALATGISCTGTPLKNSDFDAGVLLKKLNDNSCISKNGDPKWNCKAITELAPAVSYSTTKSLAGASYTITKKQSTIEKLAESNTFILLKLKSTGYVVYNKFDGQNVVVKDPSTGNTENYSIEDISKVIVYNYKSSYDNFTQEINSTSASAIPVSVLNDSLRNKMTKKEYEELNNEIYESVISAGVGTRGALVGAAVTTIKYIAEHYNGMIPYTWGGGHSDGGIKGLNKNTSALYGIDPDWGTPIDFFASNGQLYPGFGPDCSGWVMWVFHNAGLKIGRNSAKDFTKLQGVKVHQTSGDYIAQPGDLLGQEGHITLVVGVDYNNKQYYIAHANGNSGEGAVAITPVRFNTEYYYIIETTNFINNKENRISNYETEFKERTLAF